MIKTEVTNEELVKNGYKKVNQTTLEHPNASAFFQKKIEGVEHIYYFINVFEYDFSDCEQVPYEVDYTVDIQFSKGSKMYDVSFNPQTVDEIRLTAIEFYINMEFEPYETK
jgi:hypothetical protein